MRDFINGLEHYNLVELQNDWHHLNHCHIEPTNAANKGSNGRNKQRGDTDDDDDEDAEEESSEDSDSTDDDEKGSEREQHAGKGLEDKCMMVLDAENRNVYEWFEDHLGDCDEAGKCSIFERTYRSRYDVHFEEEAAKYYQLNPKERDEWLERVAEVQAQKILDGMHSILFHSSARFDAMGLGNSESHRKFVMLSTEKRKRIQRENKKK